MKRKKNGFCGCCQMDGVAITIWPVEHGEAEPRTLCDVCRDIGIDHRDYRGDSATKENLSLATRAILAALARRKAVKS